MIAAPRAGGGRMGVMPELGDFTRFVAEMGEVPRPSLHRQLFDAYAEVAALRGRVIELEDVGAGLGRAVAAERERAAQDRGEDALRIDTLRIMLREGGKRIEAALARAALLEARLREHEWEGYVGGLAACLACGGKRRDGHATECPLGTALADGG
jgi:hypothetical protein